MQGMQGISNIIVDNQVENSKYEWMENNNFAASKYIAPDESRDRRYSRDISRCNVFHLVRISFSNIIKQLHRGERGMHVFTLISTFTLHCKLTLIMLDVTRFAGTYARMVPVCSSRCLSSTATIAQ